MTIRKFYRASGASTQLKGVTPDMVLPSPNNYAEVGEKSLENPLGWDTIPSASYDKLNLIQPLLPELQKRSLARLDKDQDFIYLQEDIAQYRKALADKTVSLNEAQRLREKEEIETRLKVRQADLKSRPESTDRVYDITLKQAELPGLPAPVAKTNELTSVTNPHSPAASAAGHDAAQVASTPSGADDDEELASETKVPPVDATMKEAKRILADLISLWTRANSVAVTN